MMLSAWPALLYTLLGHRICWPFAEEAKAYHLGSYKVCTFVFSTSLALVTQLSVVRIWASPLAYATSPQFWNFDQIFCHWDPGYLQTLGQGIFHSLFYFYLA